MERVPELRAGQSSPLKDMWLWALLPFWSRGVGGRGSHWCQCPLSLRTKQTAPFRSGLVLPNPHSRFLASCSATKQEWGLTAGREGGLGDSSLVPCTARKVPMPGPETSLSFCPLARLPDGFTQLRSLGHLALNDVSLQSLPGDIGK